MALSISIRWSTTMKLGRRLVRRRFLLTRHGLSAIVLACACGGTNSSEEGTMPGYDASAGDTALGTPRRPDGGLSGRPTQTETEILQASPANVTGSPGGNITLTLKWQAVPMSTDYTVFVHFLDAHGNIVFVDNFAPPTPTSTWSGAVDELQTIAVPSSAPTGNYTISAGLFAGGDRASLEPGPGVTAVTFAQEGADSFDVGTLALYADAGSAASDAGSPPTSDAGSPPTSDAGGPPTAACTTIPAGLGPTYYVSPNGGGSGATAGSPTTIAQANQTGATLLLQAGTYPLGTTELDPASGTTWRPAPGVALGSVIFDGGNSGSLYHLVFIYGASNVTFYGLTLQHTGATWDPNTAFTQEAAVTVQNSTNVLFDSLSFYDVREVSAIQVDASDNVTASHNSFDTINNRSLSSYTDGTAGEPCASYCNNNLTYAYNVTTNAVQYGADVGAYYMEDDSHSATGSVINNNIASGFKPPVPGSAAQQTACIYLDNDQSNVLIENNICYGGAGNHYATLWHGGDHNTVKNNVFDLSQSATQIVGLYQDLLNSGGGPNYGMGNNEFSHNVVLVNSGASIWETCCGWTISYPTFSNNLYWSSFANSAPFADPSPTIADPLFVNAANPASNDYALSANSPAIESLGFEPIDTSQYGPIPTCN